MSSTPPTYAGVDAGATRTRCVVVDEEGGCSGRGRCGGCVSSGTGGGIGEGRGRLREGGGREGGVELPVTGLGWAWPVRQGHDAEDFLRL